MVLRSCTKFHNKINQQIVPLDENLRNEVNKNIKKMADNGKRKKKYKFLKSKKMIEKRKFIKKKKERFFWIFFKFFTIKFLIIFFSPKSFKNHLFGL